ncbi:Histidinol-phosphate aminotransferase [Lunatimonas lonarensis]|uniref:Histidinol-phosphate aminotransferase n=1 Tax=Lunatimonas lonarensis TaxID=1232681 RepID=R7ZWZ5_9BACT|nr:histidinol-phosphate transaminase [Lunatimonas lonarensis]EON78538.1 Histidinol-phosphate aminotransferase [Lunatimonas lonarensis]
MGFELNRLLRPHIASLKPYSSARDEYSGKEGIFLDANENPYGSITDTAFNRYPDPYQQDLKARIAEIKGVQPNQLFLGNGSDEAIDLLFRAFCRPGVDNVILLPPTYGMYEVSAGINDVATIRVSLTADFQLNVPAILEAATPNSKILFICSPNNPSGNRMKREDIHALLRNFPALVVIDEAYIDFSDEPSFTSELARYPNLLVMQTFSKAWGLASLRLGMAYASPEIIAILNKIKPPYNISGLTQATVLDALDNLEKVDTMISEILEEREKLTGKLLGLRSVQKLFPSQANFLLVKIDRAKETYDALVRQRIIVRDRSKVTLCEDCLRITVGTSVENEKLVEALDRLTR